MNERMNDGGKDGEKEERSSVVKNECEMNAKNKNAITGIWGRNR